MNSKTVFHAFIDYQKQTKSIHIKYINRAVT